MNDPGTDRRIRSVDDLDALAFDDRGLVPVVAQDHRTGSVLMVAWANEEALRRTFDTGFLTFWSRSRGAIWQKGEESGNTLTVVSLHADCDTDTILALVTPAGPACHTGETTCFGRAAYPSVASTDGGEEGPGAVLERLDRVLGERARETPEGSYTTRLLEDENLRLKKIGEESAELVAALATSDLERATEEVADLLYHALVALRSEGAGLDAVAAVLRERAAG